MKPIELFKADNFDFGSRSDNQQAADVANMYFNGWLKSAVRVYSPSSEFSWTPYKHKMDTHQALLVCVEELLKKDCEHEAILIWDGGKQAFNKCQKCGVKLQPTGWKEAE